MTMLSSVADDHPPCRPKVLTPEQCLSLLQKASAYDNRQASRAEALAWHEVAVAQRWTDFRLAVKAIIDYYGRPAKPDERRWIMPGHITEYLRAHARQPAPVTEYRRQLEAARPASDEARAAALKEIVAVLARRKMISCEESAGERKATAEIPRTSQRKAKWVAIDECDLCDHEGLRLGEDGLLLQPIVVCDHSTN